jgi:periplasmic protein TonB
MDPGLTRALEIRKTLVREAQPAAIANPGAPCVRIGGAERPTLQRKQEPQYSEGARLANHQGDAVLSITVDVDGQAKDVRLIRSLGFGLDEKALQSVLNWRFEPGRRNGQPVPVCAQIEVNFRLL